MTTAVKVKKEEFNLERLHPVWSAKYQIQTCETELKKLAETEAALAEERMLILRERDTEAPGTKTRLHDLETEITSLRVRQEREADKIKLLTDELPQLRKEAEEKLSELVRLEGRIEELADEVESLNYDIWKICDNSLVHRLRGLLSKRERVVEDLRKLPYVIRDVKSFFHLEPGVTEVEIPVLDQTVTNVGEALLKK